MARYEDRASTRQHRNRKRRRPGVFPFIILTISCVAALLVFGWYFYMSMGGGLPGNLDLSGEAPMPRATGIQEITADIAAENTCFAELESGTVLFQKNAEARIAPASTAKLLAALTVLEYCEPSEVLTIGPEIWRAAADASTAWLSEGDRLTVRQLLTALLLPSGGDAAYSAAVYTGRKIAGGDISEQQAVDAFIEAMNRKASELGAADSSFVTPDGYDADNQYTTAADLMKIAQACIGSDTIMDIAGSYSIYDIWEDGREVNYFNTNSLLNPDSAYYYPQAIGLKTGSSLSAGGCLISAARIDGRVYVSVVMGSGEEERFSDALALYGRIESESGGHAA